MYEAVVNCRELNSTDTLVTSLSCLGCYESF